MKKDKITLHIPQFRRYKVKVSTSCHVKKEQFAKDMTKLLYEGVPSSYARKFLVAYINLMFPASVFGNTTLNELLKNDGYGDEQ